MVKSPSTTYLFGLEHCRNGIRHLGSAVEGCPQLPAIAGHPHARVLEGWVTDTSKPQSVLLSFGVAEGVELNSRFGVLGFTSTYHNLLVRRGRLVSRLFHVTLCYLLIVYTQTLQK